MLTPVSVSVPVPDLVRLPEPEMAPDRVWTADEAYSKTEPFAMDRAPVPGVPVPPPARVPVSPIMSLPSLIVVAPV